MNAFCGVSMGPGDHPGNTFPRPENWIELLTSTWRGADNVAPLLDPWVRRCCFALSAERRSATLPTLASIPAFVPDADPAKALKQEQKISSYETALELGSLSSVPVLNLSIADGATTLDALNGKMALVLEAHRRFGTPYVAVALFWPVTMTAIKHGRWFQVMQHGTTVEIEEAFRSGKTPSRGL